MIEGRKRRPAPTLRLRRGLAALAAAGTVQVSLPAGAQSINYAAEPEYKINYSLAAINAAAAFGQGYTGAGIVVAVLDSGINRSNPELAAPGKVLNGYSYLTNQPFVSYDSVGHGTFVSGIIAAPRNGRGVEGVAFDATILPEQIINGAGAVSVSDYQLGQAVAFGMNHGARIFNNSWNSSTTITQITARTVQQYSSYSLPAWQQAVSRGALVIFAAGNSSTAQVGYLAGLPALFPNLQSGWIAAVATDSTGAIASYSDRCGIAAAWCMAAPGTSIVSAYLGGLGIGSGTSFSAPAIAGAAADLLQEFPYLTAAQIGQILLKTANKNGIYANSAIYGQGLLDLQAATRPVGTTSIPTSGSVAGPAASLGHSGILAGSPFGGFNARSVGPVLVLDSYQRGYQIDGAALVGSQGNRLDIRDTLARFGNGDLAEIAPGVKAAFAPAGPAALVTNGPAAGDRATSGRMRMQMTGRDGSVFEFSIGTDPALAFGSLASGAVPAAALIVEDGVGNPYLNLAQDGMAASVALPSAVGPAALSLGLFEGYSRSSALDVRLGDPSYIPPHVGGAVAGLGVAAGSATRLGFDLGLVLEQGAFLGSTSGGAFGTVGDTPTLFAGLDAETSIGHGLTLFGNVQIGRSTPGVSPGALVTGYSAVTTQSFALGVVQTGWIAPGESIGLTVSQPLRATGGSVALDIPYARDFSGGVLSHAVNAPLAAQGRELDLQTFYAGTLPSHVKFDAGLVARLQPGNQIQAPVDLMGIVKLKAGF